MQHGAQVIVFTSLLSAVLFARFAYALAKHPSITGGRLVPVAHACAWGGVSFLLLHKAVFVVVSTVAPERIGVLSVLVLTGFVAVGLVVWGLGTYVVQVWLSAARRLTLWWAGLAAAQTLLLATAYLAARPLVVVPDGVDLRMAFERPDVGGLLFALMVPTLLFVLLVSLYVFQVVLVEDRRLVWRIRCATFAMSFGLMATGLGWSYMLGNGSVAMDAVQAAASVLAVGMLSVEALARTRTSQAMDAMTTRPSV